MLAGKPAFQFLTVKEVDGVAVIAFLETASMIEGDKVESLAKELFGLIETKKYKKILLNLYNAGYMSSAMLAQLVTHRKMQDVNTPPRLKSCGFWANPPVGKLCPRAHSRPFGRRRSRRCGPDRGTRRNRIRPNDPRAKHARTWHRNPSMSWTCRQDQP